MLSSFFADLDRSGDRPIVAADLVLGIALAAVAVLSGFYVDANRPDTIEPGTWWHWALMVVPSLMVIVRRTRPLATLLVAAVAQALVWVVGLPDVLLPMLVLLYSASSEGGDRGVRVSLALTVVLTAITSVGVIVTDDVTPYLVPLIAISFVTAIAGGANAARQRRRAGELATAVAETRLRGEHERAAAIADERAHIARELHDVVGHTLSVIAVRAEAADRVATQNPEAPRDAVAAIASTARSALTDTRRVLAGLRASAELELAPPPDLDAIRQLVAGLTDAGIDASLTMTGDPRPTSPLVAGGAYRIVQESLTNAVKHGPPDVRIEVALTNRPHHLEIEVRSTLGTDRDPDLGRTDGSGLAGMAERADVLGGSLRAGVDDGHFVVRAELPTDDTRPTMRNDGVRIP